MGKESELYTGRLVNSVYWKCIHIHKITISNDEIFKSTGSKRTLSPALKYRFIVRGCASIQKSSFVKHTELESFQHKKKYFLSRFQLNFIPEINSLRTPYSIIFFIAQSLARCVCILKKSIFVTIIN